MSEYMKLVREPTVEDRRRFAEAARDRRVDEMREIVDSITGPDADWSVPLSDRHADVLVMGGVALAAPIGGDAFVNSRKHTEAWLAQ